jgi:hypothetical protein
MRKYVIGILVLGLLAACAILFPQFVVFILLFPVPIRVAAIGFIFVFLAFVITKGDNAGGHAAHLAGMAAGAGYVFSENWRNRIMLQLRSRDYEKKMERETELQYEVDRILEKVHSKGIHSLSRKEKKILKKATESERIKKRF